ncbi:efflux transporter outer membrane subunit [Lysobacter gummosus]|uniref:Efflux transporter outer membrane subunit n=1 Tax=Lysobacter gummosus TaxID=262324 RepID=A0ABY3XJF2_9GAMM|nr:efflux transporter outer membrane subunit [Lysobacter gummosus]ALN91412.1 efflux transporter, outer membrane factor (OMF) lipo, NodT family protein [Lysobacter gummosus]UNP31787.1 efflux transporter outer membrane subunit [Lysobacter gummosus]
MRIRVATIALALSALSGCAAGPDYVRPNLSVPAQYKEAEGWNRAVPADALDRGHWWSLFQDPALDALMGQVEVSNQNLAAAEAAYRQARALVREQRASLFPTVSLDGSGTRARSAGNSGSSVGQSYRYDIGASWEPDLWGRIRRNVEGASAQADSSAADLASARLAAQGELAANYFQLRESDIETRLLQATVEAYQRSLKIAGNRYAASIAPKSDVLQARTQLANAQANLADLGQQRAQLEHAIAVLVGRAPADFAIAADPAWHASVPELPPSVASDLLQRRPDIASAERRVAAANAQVGAAQAAFFPSFTLSASRGGGASQLGRLFDAPSSLWSLGVALAQTLFDGGARRAGRDAARAGYDQSVALYRQTALTAFQDVENQLVATNVLVERARLFAQASQSADEAERIALNRYQAGLVAYTDVVVAQATALSARQSLAQATRDRQTTAVALIQALGGGWHAEQGG